MAASVKASGAMETVVPDELIKHYPEPSEGLHTLLLKVPNTGKMLFQYIQHKSISMEWKYWAIDLLENGMETPGIVRLAGEDLDMFPTAFADLLDTIFRELNLAVDPETACCSFIICIAAEVLRGERSPRSGFDVLADAAISVDYKQPLADFYHWREEADIAYVYEYKGSGLRMDNVDEWMFQYFEKLVKANASYAIE